MLILTGLVGLALMGAPATPVPEAAITVHAGRVLHPVSRYMTGVCIEDVNHEIYGGLYSQMLYGESFQEPSAAPSVRGFTACEGVWSAHESVLSAPGGTGPKLVADGVTLGDGEVSVDVRFADRASGNAGLILRVVRPAPGADMFDGYEVALDPEHNVLRLGRHRHDFTLLSDTPCPVPVGQWVRLNVRFTGGTLEAMVDGRPVARYADAGDGLPAGSVGLRTWQRTAEFRDLSVASGGVRKPLPFEAAEPAGGSVSGMWRPICRGGAVGVFALDRKTPFVGTQSQVVRFSSGKGEVGIANEGLNRWGLHVEGGKRYIGHLCVRTADATKLTVVIESAGGREVLAAKVLAVKSGADWQALDFALTPRSTADKAQLVVSLKRPGEVELGYARLEPGAWGRYKGLPVRRDVAAAMVNQGITVLRYGGSMVNAPEYRWKKMIGPRDERPPYTGTWYPYASNGWGIVDFVAFAQAVGMRCIPAFNMDETPQDMADFVEYMNGPADSAWGRKRVADGFLQPFHLKYMELGNEEHVDESYWMRFKPMAEAIWAKDPDIVLVVGDFFYSQRITDPFKVSGAAVTTLAAHQKILKLAKEHDREVWFDIHVGTETPPQPGTLEGERSFIDQLGALSEGARFRVAVFELNAGNHAMRRGLSNALAMQQAVQVGDRLEVVCSANGLQPDGQNDNGWDQGLLFLNPGKVWLQAPGYVLQMVSASYQPLLVSADTSCPANRLSVTAHRSRDGKQLVVRVVNPSDLPVATAVELDGFRARLAAEVTELAGPLDAHNTADAPAIVTPRRYQWTLEDGAVPSHTFPAYSFTVLQFTGATATAKAKASASLTPVPIQSVSIDDGFWTPRRRVWEQKTIRDCFAKFEKDGAFANFDQVRNGVKGGHHGPTFFDGLVYEMIRGTADFLAASPDPELQRQLDGYIERIAAAAEKDGDGYINTWTQLESPSQRWALNGGNDVFQHDVYNAGALVEAGAHYYRATGSTRLLRVATRMASLMARTIGPAPKKNVIPGHAIAEEALVDLYRLYRANPSLKKSIGVPVDEREYLQLADFFIAARGNIEGRTGYLAYDQDSKPVAEQATIEGHAVRATLMCTGLTALADAEDRPDYREDATRLWDNMARRKLYITGGVGATADGEAFGPDYVLPNDGYLETCAAIGAGFFSRNLNLLTGDARYADELETALYNGALGGVALSGDEYSYVNPLQFDVGHSRWSWHGCPCCPPMFTKIMGAMPGYVYAIDPSGLYVNLYVGSRAKASVGGADVVVRQTTAYPWEGSVRLSLDPAHPAAFELRLRVPCWCQRSISATDLYQPEGLPVAGAFHVRVNGSSVEDLGIRNGYARIRRTWRSGDVVEVSMDMPVRRVRANASVDAAFGKVALMRGPIVYAVEMPAGGPSAGDVTLPAGAALTAEYREDLLGGVTVLRGGLRVKGEDASVVAIPYFSYLNRGPASLRVWIPEVK